jgi:hypothetical protein
MIPILIVVGVLSVAQAVLASVATPGLVAHLGRAATWGLGLGGLVLSLVVGIGAVRRVPTTALLVLLPGLLLTSCTPPVTLSLALQARVAALADHLAVLPVDPETGAPGATALLAAWRVWVAASAPAPSVPVHAHWEPRAPEEVSNVP